jgi:hypothetical protein
LPVADVTVDVPPPPSVEVAETQTLGRSAPPTTAVTVPEMLALTAIAALILVAGDATEVATANASAELAVPAALPLNH